MKAETRLDRAYCALEGLSVGDAFGQRFFRVHTTSRTGMVTSRWLGDGPWPKSMYGKVRDEPSAGS